MTDNDVARIPELAPQDAGRPRGPQPPNPPGVRATPAPPSGPPVAGLPAPTSATPALPIPTIPLLPATTTAPATTQGPAIVRSFAGALVEGTFLVDPLAPIQIVQYQDRHTVISQSRHVIADCPPAQVLSLGYETRQSFVRVTPGWAILVGVLGLLFFLIGIVFFFVKENRPVVVRVLTLRLTDGRYLTITQP